MTRKVEGGTAIKPLPFRGGVGVGPVGFAQGRRPPPAATRQQAAKFRCPPLKGRVYWRQSARVAANRRSTQSGPVAVFTSHGQSTEERRSGTERARTGRYRWSPCP